MRVEVLTARSLTLNMCALKLRLLDCALQLHGWTRSKPSHIAAHLYYTLVSHLLLWQGVLKFYFMEKIENLQVSWTNVQIPKRSIRVLQRNL